MIWLASTAEVTSIKRCKQLLIEVWTKKGRQLWVITTPCPPEQQSLVLLTIWKYIRSKADKTKQNSTLVRLNWVENNTSNFVSCVFICQLVNHFDNKIYISILSTHCIFKEYNFDGLITSNNDQFCQKSNFKVTTLWRKQVASSLLVNKPDNWKQDLAPTKIERYDAQCAVCNP